ncbi:FecR family protein [Stigmatella sp. ncwal1]|uniref:FecR family protein n=1 Tax=Stigmatella ashevillensis TaxID=2995309 RepID=A0ABT5D382_9BACT|nr:FecR family protein [Stigmatella ashevillena]MDC0708134.1 FecR family protein [Stigmatella ashevillena]
MAGSQNVRRQAPFLLGLALILAALPIGYFVFLREPPPPPVRVPPPPPVVEVPAPSKPVQLSLQKVEGTVEVRRGGGAWAAAQAGEALHPTDAVRTQDSSSAVIIGDEEVEVLMGAGTEVSVDSLTDELSRVLLETGMATATVRPGKRHTFEVKAANSDALARTTAGTFTMSNDGAGTVAVGAREGEVTFLGRGKVVIVRAGQQSVVTPTSGGPSEPAPVPTSLLRKVAWPDGRRNQRRIKISGEVVPGSRLQVGGQHFYPGPDGKFERIVELKEGENFVQLRASSVGGTEQEEGHYFKVDTSPPKKLKVDLPWGNSSAPPAPTQTESP